MSTSRKRIMVAGAAGVLSVGIMATPALADTQGQSQGLTGGTLSETSAGLTFTTTALTGATFDSTSSSSPWTVVNPTGTDAAWSLSATSTALTSAAGTTEGENLGESLKTIPATQLRYASNTVTADTDSDPVTDGNFTKGDPTHSADYQSLTSGNSYTVVVVSAHNAKGTYHFTPTAKISILANQYRANHTVGNAGAYNPYTADLILTIA